MVLMVKYYNQTEDKGFIWRRSNSINGQKTDDDFSHITHDFLWGQGLLVLFEKLTTITSLVSTRRLIAVPVANISMTSVIQAFV